jgi:plasmid maintenance system antidote protein VapI
MTVKIEEFVAHLGWEVDPGDLEEFDKQVNKITDTFKKVAVAIGAATAAVTALIVHTNKETAEMANLAKSVGITVDNLQAITGVVSEMGLNFENVIDLVEEMNNKIGEKKGLGQFTAVEESMKLLNLQFKDLEDLEPDQQFIKILDAAARLDDQQRAVSAVDMLFGGEANKILGFIREMDMSLEEIIERRKQLNFLSQEGVDGAVSFNRALTETKGIVGSVWAQFSGLVGEALKPLLEEFNEWVIQNRELIKTKVAEWAEKVSDFLEIMWKFLKFILGILKKVTDLFGGLGNTLAIIAGLIAGLTFVNLIKAVKLLTTVLLPGAKQLGLFKAALNFGKLAGTIGLIVLAALAINSLVRFLQGKDSLVGDIGESIAEKMDESTASVAEFFGLTKEEFQLWLVQTVDSIEDFFVSLGETIVGFLEEFRTIQWGEVWEVWKEIFFEGVETIKSFFMGLLDFILNMPDRILEVFKELPNKVLGIVRKIPGIGSALSKFGSFVSGASIVEAATRQTGSPGLANQIQQNRTLQNITNRQRTATQVTNHNRMNITQNPGEDSERFANRVVTILEENAATAVRNNKSGVRV